jgi:hypothetical protein
MMLQVQAGSICRLIGPTKCRSFGSTVSRLSTFSRQQESSILSTNKRSVLAIHPERRHISNILKKIKIGWLIGPPPKPSKFIPFYYICFLTTSKYYTKKMSLFWLKILKCFHPKISFSNVSFIFT